MNGHRLFCRGDDGFLGHGHARPGGGKSLGGFFEGGVKLQDAVEAQQFDDALDLRGEAGELEVSLVFAGTAREADQGAEGDTADVVQIAAIEDDPGASGIPEGC
ncbi:MAG: hypothetical protein U1G05_03920 [Kiritimatiellia bacterium]